MANYHLLLVVLLALPVFGEFALAQEFTQADRRRESFLANREKLMLNLRYELSELSDQLHTDGLNQAAADVTAISLELTSPTRGQSPPKFVQLPISKRLSAEQQSWRNRLRSLRTEKAREFYILARKALNSKPKLPSLAYQIILDVLRMDPDHQNARAVLGQQLFRDRLRVKDPTYAGEWVSPFEAKKRSGTKAETDHPTFGWIPVSHVQRYEEGLRPWRGQWISTQKEAALRRDFRNGWEIRTEHFLVRTNTSREEGVEISRKLEIFHDWFQTNFAAFFETPETLVKRFEQVSVMRRGGTTLAPMEIYYYSSRREYDENMRDKIPPGIVTNGLYWEPDRRSYSFRNPKAEGLSTIFHEGTHQILDHASRDDRLSAARQKRRLYHPKEMQPWVLCEKSNFWMVEGLACYLESFEIKDGVVSVGRPDHVRFVAAQTRLLEPEYRYYLPLQPFSSLGQKEFQHHPKRSQLYSQASGVAHFLLHYRDGIYRDNFVTLLSRAYRPDLRNLMKDPELDEIAGVPFAKLDQQYRDHIENIAIQVQAAGQKKQAARK